MEANANKSGNLGETRLLLDAKALAAVLGISKATIWRMRDSGKLPHPVKLGSMVRWRTEDITAWLRDRCPNVDGRNSAG